MKDLWQTLQDEFTWIGLVTVWVVRGLLLLAAAAVFMWGWQYALVPLLGLAEIGFWQSFAVVMMARALVGFPEISRSHTLRRMRHQQLELKAILQRLILELQRQQPPTDASEGPAQNRSQA
jgi:hypothetical protein